MSPSVQPSQTVVTAPAHPAAQPASAGNAASVPAPAATAVTAAPRIQPGPVETLPAKAEGSPAAVTAVTGNAPAAGPIAPDSKTSNGADAMPSRQPNAVPGPRANAPVLAAWLGTNGAPLAGKAMEFNRYPLRYAHPSWVPAKWQGPWMERLRDGGRAEASLGEALLKHWKVDTRPCFEFAAPSKRLALVDGDPLRKTVLLAGIARHADEVSRIMERAKVMELKSQVGEDAYKFAVFRAPLLAGPLAQGGNSMAAAATDWKAKCMASGMGMFGACLAGGPPGLAGRAGLKFPREYAPYMRAGGGEGSTEGYVRLFRKVLAQEVDPAWDSMLS